MNKHPMANYRTESVSGKVLYHFFCDLSGALVCTVKHASDPQSAWESGGRQRFNRCRQCGRWVCDAMFNPDTLQCVDCSPWEEQPSFCSQCGAKAAEGELFCRCCGARLQYGEEVNAYEGTD